MLRQIARDRQRHAHDTAFGRCVSSLADLPIKGGDWRRIDDHARFFAIHSCAGEQGGKARNDVEAADQVDLDSLAERVQRMGRTILAHDTKARRNARAVHQHTRRPQLRFGRCQPRIHGLGAGHIDLMEAATQPFGERRTSFLVQVEDRHASAKLGQPFGSRTAQPRSAASDDSAQILNVHDRSSLA